jgi:hypothetical protein
MQIREFGLGTVFARMVAPDGVLYSQSEPSTVDVADQVKKRESIQIIVSEITPTTIGLRLVEKLAVRGVSLIMSNGIASLEKTALRRAVEEGVVFLPFDEDGGFRFTDGKSIFEIIEQDSKLRLTEFIVIEEPKGEPID